MALIDRMKEARRSKGLTQERLAHMIGVAKSTYAGYEKGSRDPSMLVLQKIMGSLGIDANFLFQDEVDALGGSTIKLHYNESEHIKKYRTLDEHGKRIIDFVLKEEHTRCTLPPEDEEDEDNLIPLRMSEQSAAAGTGTYLGPECFKTVYVRYHKIARHASYCIPIKGDSMEPIYRDGDILLVSSEDAEIGDIGIFTLDGKGFVKKLDSGVLLSLNDKYKPIPLDESIKCNGKVIGVLDPNIVVR